MPKPILHARDHAPGGADPIPIAGGNAVLFDTYPQAADYLVFEVASGIAMENTDDSPVSITQSGNEVIHIENTGEGQINIESSGEGGVVIECSGIGSVIITVSGGNLVFDGLPTSAPPAAGAVWNDGGTLKIA